MRIYRAAEKTLDYVSDHNAIIPGANVTRQGRFRKEVLHACVGANRS